MEELQATTRLLRVCPRTWPHTSWPANLRNDELYYQSCECVTSCSPPSPTSPEFYVELEANNGRRSACGCSNEIIADFGRGAAGPRYPFPITSVSGDIRRPDCVPGTAKRLRVFLPHHHVTVGRPRLTGIKASCLGSLPVAAELGFLASAAPSGSAWLTHQPSSSPAIPLVPSPGLDRALEQDSAFERVQGGGDSQAKGGRWDQVAKP